MAANAVFLGRVVVASLYALPGDVAALGRAAAIMPYIADAYAPDPSVQAGHLLDSQGRAEEALRYYYASLAHDPHAQPVWLLVASAEERAGRYDRAEHAYQQAVERAPNQPETYWMRANYLLRRGRTQESLAQFRELLRRTRAYDAIVFETAWRLEEPAAVERDLLAAGGPADLPYLRFAIERADAAASRRAWVRMQARLPEIRPEEINAYSRLLAGAADYEAAWQAWRHWAHARGEGAGGLVRDGGFERGPLAGPFDWTFHSGAALHAFRDTSVAHSQAASAQVLFLGTENFEGAALEQWVRLAPHQWYRLSFVWRARDLSSDRAPAVQVWELGSHARLLCSVETSAGTSPWQRESVRFRVGEIPLMRIAVVRSASRKLDPVIRGSFWLDDVEIAAQ